MAKDKKAPLLGTRDAAQALKICENTVRKWADTNRLPSVRDSTNRRLFDVSDIAAFKRAQERS